MSLFTDYLSPTRESQATYPPLESLFTDYPSPLKMFFLGYLSSALESLFTGYLSLTGEPHYMLPIPHFRAFLTGYLSSTRKAFSYYATYLLLESLFTGCWEQKEPFNVPFWEETNNEKADLLEELRKKTNLSVLNYKKKIRNKWNISFQRGK